MDKRIALAAAMCIAAAAGFSQGQDIFYLAAQGSADQVMAAIRAGADVNARVKPAANDDAEDMTLLMLAAGRRGDPDVISALIKAGVDVNARTTRGAIRGMTALMYAAVNGRAPKAVFPLLAAGADVNAENKQGTTALLFAASSNKNQGVATALIRAGARIDKRDFNGYTALEIALQWNDTIAVAEEMLQAIGPSLTKELASSALRIAVGNVSIEPRGIKLLLDAGADVNSPAPKNGYTAILDGAACGFEVVDLLLKAGAKVNIKNSFGQTPLIIAACLTKDPRVLGALLDAGADPKGKDNDGMRALDYA
jgi:ankyrin repeat protein